MSELNDFYPVDNLVPDVWEELQDEEFMVVDEIAIAINGYENLTLGDLLQTGWDWGSTTFTSYSMKPETLEWLRPRLTKKINNMYYFRDLGIAPVGKWVKVFNYVLENALDQYGPLYDAVINGIEVLDNGREQEKLINVDSEFPQARLLMEQEDYASNSNELYREKVASQPQIDSLVKYTKEYMELDSLVLKQLETCFSSFVDTSMF